MANVLRRQLKASIDTCRPLGKTLACHLKVGCCRVSATLVVLRRATLLGRHAMCVSCAYAAHRAGTEHTYVGALSLWHEASISRSADVADVGIIN